ncbi:MAG: prevent-host-death protein [Coriobacteriales bacterium]|jgi:PHD/YefM family antitoxin component YafN of YafNO toxin-antitoxin module|nr:prevent-host-death protein [Coriobacteriales bacterium]
MSTIDKISSLRNYQAVLDKVEPGSPVFLTKNGTGRYVIADTAEYDFLYRTAFGEFFKKLNESRAEAEREGWITEDAVRARFGILADV